MYNVYFAKINLDHEDVYNMSDSYVRSTVFSSIIMSLEDGVVFHDIHTYITEDHERKEEEIEYSLGLFKRELSLVEGILYRKGLIFVKEKDDYSNDIKTIPVNNTESIHFCYDVEHEIIAFIETRRFKRVMFCKAFEMLLNICAERKSIGYRFYVELLNKGMSLEDLKKEIASKDNMKEIEIVYRPTNPDRELLKKLEEKEMKDRLMSTNSTERCVIYKSHGGKTIDGNSDMIKSDLEQLVEIADCFPIEELTKRGYIKVKTTDTEGKVSSTTENRPFIRRVASPSDLLRALREGIVDFLK